MEFYTLCNTIYSVIHFVNFQMQVSESVQGYYGNRLIQFKEKATNPHRAVLL